MMSLLRTLGFAVDGNSTKQRVFIASFGALFLLACSTVMNVAWSLDSDLTIRQFNHEKWDGSTLAFAPAGVTAFVQDQNGHLWLASPNGLYNFNGVRFSTHGDIGDGSLSAMTAVADALWIGYRHGGVGVVEPGKSGRFYEPRDRLPDGRVNGFAQERSGAVWVATENGLARFDENRWSRVGSESGFEDQPALGILVDRDDTVWVATQDAVFSMGSARRSFQKVIELARRTNTPKRLIQSRDGAIWLSGAGLGLLRLPANGHTFRSLFAGLTIEAPIFDRDGNLWMAGGPLRRLRSADLDGDPVSIEARVETFTQLDGLSGDVVESVFEDSDGNIWVGTNLGVDKFRVTAIKPIVPPHDIAAWRTAAIVADNAAGVWVAPDSGGLLRYQNGRLTTRIRTPVFSAATRASDGSLWFGGRDGIGRLRGDQLEIQSLPEAAKGRDVQTLALDGKGALWVSIADGGLFRRSGDTWVAWGGLDELPRDKILSSAVDDQGDVWLGYVRDRVAKVSGSQVTLYTHADGLNVGSVTALGAEGSRVWIGGERALAVLDRGRVHMTERRNCGNFSLIAGVLESQSGDLWVFRDQGLSRVPNVEGFIERGEYMQLGCTHQFARGSGVHAPAQLRPTPALIESTDGQLWISTVDQVLWTDPQLAVSRPVQGERFLGHETPGAIITFLRGAQPERAVQPDRVEPVCKNAPDVVCQLPVHTKDIIISLSSVRTSPDVRFRYRLIGYDEGWRLTFQPYGMFGNLDPGRYRVEVGASFTGHVWDATPAAIELVIAPAFYQTAWFRGLCAIAGLTALIVLFRFQVRRAGIRLREKLEARMFERERIARELHDTLLQGIQGLIMKIHAVALQMPQREPARETLHDALDQAEKVLIEGRDRVTELRYAAAGDRDITNDLAAVGERLAEGRSIEFHCSAHGAARALHPIVRDEAFLIVREMLLNAFRHAAATRISIEIMFEAAALRIVVTDDGVGIPPDILAAGGREGHWGLQGMRERAARIRASLFIGANLPSGSRAELRIASIIAYSSHKLMSWLDPGRSISSAAHSKSSEELL